VHPFLTEMELALGAATVSISRSGASSLAEIAAMRIPSILIPCPHAADNHQYYNALSYAETGAALVFDQNAVSVERFAAEIAELLTSEKARTEMQASLCKWHTANAAEMVAQRIVAAISPCESEQLKRAKSSISLPQDQFLKVEKGANV